MKNAQIWKLASSHKPIVKIEYTIYDFNYVNARGKKSRIEVDASILWNGVRAPKGAKMLAIIKVPSNDAKSALWAYQRWVGLIW